MKTERVTASVEWLDVAEIDTSFTKDVPLVPNRAEQAILTPALENETDQLFDFERPSTFATFAPFPGYIKQLFHRRVLATFDTDQAMDILDKVEFKENADSEKIFDMLYTLNDLNDLLESIYFKILSTLKP